MKNALKLFIILLLILPTNLYPQSPIVQQIINSVNIDSMIFFDMELSGEVATIINGTPQSILSRHKNQPGNELAKTYIQQKLESYGFTVTIQNFSATGNNVLATQVGTVYPNKKFIICAHYDDMPAGTTAPGADDNGSSVAAVIEAARIFTQYSFPFTIVYAFWDEEEQGLFGSTYYANAAGAAGDSILGVINLEMLGWDSNGDLKCTSEEAEVVHRVQIRNNLIEVNDQYGINLNVIPSPPYASSDQAGFWYNGYDAIEFHQYTYEDRNIYYHTLNDRVQYLNQPYYLKMAKLALGTFSFLALGLNFDLIHRPIPTVIPTQATNTNLFIYTLYQIGSESLSPRMYYRTKAFGGNYGDFNVLVGTQTGEGNFTFEIPALSNGDSVQYYLAAQDENSTIVRTSPLGGGGYNPPGSIPPETFYEFLVADLEVVWSDSADNLSNWTTTAGWNITTEKFVSPPTSFTDSPGGNYPPNTVATLTYNDQFTGWDTLKTFLEFDTQWAMEYGYMFDYAQVQLTTNNSSSWIPLEGQYTFWGRDATILNFEPYYGGVQTNWVHEIMDITGYASQPFKFRYLIKSDDLIFLDGWYLDNIKISVFDEPVDVKDIDQLPTEFSLAQNYPNPFNPSTRIKYQVASNSRVSLVVYDILGNEIETLVNEVKPAGTYEVTWYAENLPSGVYFYQLRAGSFVDTKKMILLK
jgi:hypothetical protein